MDEDSKITIESINVFNNSSYDNADGIYIGMNVEDINGGAVKLYNSIIGENGAVDKGGGICTDSSVLMRNTSINNNSSRNWRRPLYWQYSYGSYVDGKLHK